MWHKRRKQHLVTTKLPVLNNQIDCHLTARHWTISSSLLLLLTSMMTAITIIGATSSGTGGGSSSSSSSSGSSGGHCPDQCECKWSNGKETVNCDKSLNGIPVGIPSTTQVLNLTGIHIAVLPAQVFRERRLINVQKLFMAKCKLGEISDEAFLQLTNLVELDLCDNSLDTIPTLSLQKCKSIRKLSLCMNAIRFVRIDSFASLQSLVSIDLSQCQIDTVESNAFHDLHELRSLKLNANRLHSLSGSALTGLQVLHALDLHQNPWHCDCQLRHTVQWLQHNGIPQSVWPICQSPHRLQGHYWNALNIDEFSCAPVFHTQKTNFHTNIGQNITIYCTASGYPLPGIHWKLGVDYSSVDYSSSTTTTTTTTTASTSITANNRMMTREHRNNASKQHTSDDSQRFFIETVAVNETFVSSYITINDLRVYDTQQLICLAANKGGSAYKNFTIAVSSQPYTSSSMAYNMSTFHITCYATGAIIAVLLVLILLLMPFIRTKRRRSVRHSSTVSPSKLGAIDILQNIKCSDEDMGMKTLYTNKPEIALISDIIKDTTDLKPYRFSGGIDPLTAPDVTNFGCHYSNAQTVTLSAPTPNHSSMISTSMSFDTFRHHHNHTPQPMLALLDSNSEQKYLYNNSSNSVQQQAYGSRFHYQKLNTFSPLATKTLANGALTDCQKLVVPLSANNSRVDVMSGGSSTTTTAITTVAITDMPSAAQEHQQQQQCLLKPYLSHSQSHCLELDKELVGAVGTVVVGGDVNSAQSILNASNNVSVTQV
ncbi:leucine-rich repeat-containing protein 4C-like [Oppia nitens]|uniref:leucine-rich repeat-containing protein 4C-like n=1 Tax=Oppia nitens TaxID=1686743 RepID=UPI0023DC8801|nr:leucine-rich repeat-containing protein 4C-like [Oppia nitens]